MNRNLLMPVAVSLILLSGCKYNDDNFEGLDEMTQPTNLMKIEYTLTDAMLIMQLSVRTLLIKISPKQVVYLKILRTSRPIFI